LCWIGVENGAGSLCKIVSWFDSYDDDDDDDDDGEKRSGANRTVEGDTFIKKICHSSGTNYIKARIVSLAQGDVVPARKHDSSIITAL